MSSIIQREKPLSEETADQDYLKWLDDDASDSTRSDQRPSENLDADKQPFPDRPPN